MRRFAWYGGVLFCLFMTGCAVTSKAPNFNGLKDIDGSDGPVHINMTKAAIHFAVAQPFIGDATLDGAVEDFTKAAIEEGADRVRIVQSNETTLWWILPPISFILTPKFTNVAGDALRGEPRLAHVAPLGPNDSFPPKKNN